MSRELCHPFKAYIGIVRELLLSTNQNPIVIAVYDTATKELAESIMVSFQCRPPSMADIVDVYPLTITVKGDKYQQRFYCDASRLAVHVYYARLHQLFMNTLFTNTPAPVMSQDFDHPLEYAHYKNINLDYFVWHNGHITSEDAELLFQFDFSENELASKTGQPLTEGEDLAYMRNVTEIGFMKSDGRITLKGLSPDAIFRVINGWNIFRDQSIETIQSIGRGMILGVPIASNKEQG